MRPARAATQMDIPLHGKDVGLEFGNSSNLTCVIEPFQQNAQPSAGTSRLFTTSCARRDGGNWHPLHALFCNVWTSGPVRRVDL